LIYRSETVINKSQLLSKAAYALGIPRIVTEQYPSVFGPTVPELLDGACVVGDGAAPSVSALFGKKKFSMMTDETTTAFRALAKNQVRSFRCISTQI
jgi:hypothetical protein